MSEATKTAPVLGTRYDRPASLDNPRSPRRKNRTNFELYGWLFMRFSGVALIVLVCGHLITGLMIGNGVHRVDFSYVAGRWNKPLWEVWDLLMLWLAQLHGGNGLRTIIADYSRKDSTRFWLNTLLAVAMVLIMVLGAYTIFTFNPDIPAK